VYWGSKTQSAQLGERAEDIATYVGIARRIPGSGQKPAIILDLKAVMPEAKSRRPTAAADIILPKKGTPCRVAA
jgi:hypothetical protein